MYKVAICDDENIFLKHLLQMTKEILDELHIPSAIKCYRDPRQLVKDITEHPNTHHLLLLDILMEQMNGVELARLLRQHKCKISIIFVTISKDYALEGYSVFPIHYIVKPVDKCQLKAAITKDYEERFQPKHIQVEVNKADIFLPIADVPFIESINRVVLIHSKQGRPNTEFHGTLKELLQILPWETFVQCHKSFIVNVSMIQKLSRSSALLYDNISIPVGRAYYDTTYRAMIRHYCQESQYE